MWVRLTAMAVGAACAGAAVPAAAQVDQQNTTGTASISTSSGVGIGQSFTPTLSGLNFVTVNLNSQSASTNGQASASLFAGAGFGGANLGTSNLVTISGTTNKAYSFSFNSLIPLTPGNTYTFDVTTQTGNLVFQFSTNNPYTGGTLYQGSGAGAGNSAPTADLRFAEGIAAAPEPAAWSLMIIGFGIVGGTLRRQRRQGSLASVAA